MLLGENFRRRKQGALFSVCRGNAERVDRNRRFTGADVALQQTVHRGRFSHVCRNLLDDAKLRFRGRERELRKILLKYAARVERKAVLANPIRLLQL
ncbi:hypothetical protein SDC9_151421 [bioreactor metagenome]|uniref:Uncharacterized protein n=1 Tax=bioreactor metagenome TaxID=1076179 RepID=A0A645EQ90_9ZZZZ